MIQQRSNPFEQSEIETNEQEEAKIQKRINRSEERRVGKECTS